MRFTATRILRHPVPAAKSYSATLQLPRSSFPPRPSAQQLSRYLPAVTDELYKWNISRPDNKTRGTFVLHDGPPYANGRLHVGHALNKILKDVVNRYELAQGKKVKYVPGWDCHGLPIEIKALKGRSGKGMDAIAVRKAARALAEATIKQQMDGFKSWAVMGDWDGAYRTMDKSFELRQLDVFKRLVEKGLIYRQHKPVYWSPSSRTALAESELEYLDQHQSQAAFVAYEIVEPPSSSTEDLGLLSDVYAVIWTTTPWTLPANRAIAVNDKLSYCIVEFTNSLGRPQKLLIEESRLDHLRERVQSERYTLVTNSIPGSSLVGAKYRNALSPEVTQQIVHADFVSSASGTGLVHMAPGHGMEDYEVCMAFGLSAFAPVDDEGNFTDAALPSDPAVLSGKNVQGEGVAAVLDCFKRLGERHHVDLLLGTHKILHRYPIDWRTKLPVIVRATEQWFADVGSIKEAAINASGDVHFVPEAGADRLESFIDGRSQWCISRQRAWGVPIPALYRVDDGSNTAVMTVDTIDHIIEVIKERGTDAWWTDAEDDLSWIPRSLEGKYIRGKDTMDVWFDSGTTWTMLDERYADTLADVYLEGSDQHRGWFQSSLLTYVAMQMSTDSSSPSAARAPFDTLITHGFTLDGNGRKMSKSLGNVVAPEQIMEGPQALGESRKGSSKGKPSTNMGPDALRLWAASNDYTTDIVIGAQALENNHRALQKYRITFKWLLGCLADFSIDYHASWQPANACLADRIALHQLSATSKLVHTAYSWYEFFKGLKAVESFVHTDLSAFYFESVKDRVYAGLSEDRQAAQAVLHLILMEMLAWLAPVTPLMVEEVWQHLPPQLRQTVHPFRARGWFPYSPPWENKFPPPGMSGLERALEVNATRDALETQIKEVRAIHAALKIAAEKARSDGKMGTSLDCDVDILIPTQKYKRSASGVLRQEMADELDALLVVSEVTIYRDGDLPSSEEHIADVDAWTYSAALDNLWHAEGARVVVKRPRRHKCPRCWRHTADEKDTLCVRCNVVINVK